MNFCGSCGQQLDENALVCMQCGAPQKSVAAQSRDSTFGFKTPGEYDGVPPVQPLYPGADPSLPQTRPITAPPHPGITHTDGQRVGAPTPPQAPTGPPKPPGEHTCPNCNGLLIFSLARGLWACPNCNTEVPGLPPPTTEIEPEPDEIMEQTQQMLYQQPAGLPAGPLPEKGEEFPKPKMEKPPEEVGGVTRNKAAESIIEIQNLLEEKSKTGLYSLDAETTFESCKMSFTENDYPAVIQLTRQIKEILEKDEKIMKDEKEGPKKEDMLPLPPGGRREQAIQALQSARDLIAEAEKLGFDVTESKKIFKQGEPAFRAGDYETATHFAHDTEESVNAVLGGKRLARAPQAGAGAYSPGGSRKKVYSESKNFFFRFLIPLGGLIVLMTGAVLAWMSYDDSIWNPFSDGPYDWGPYNTTGVILGLTMMVIGAMFAVLPLILIKKIYVKVEPPKPVEMKQS